MARFTKLLTLTIATTAAGIGLALAPGSAALASTTAPWVGPGYSEDPDAVACVQVMVGADLDGDYGQETYDKVKQWQSDHGLEPDGIVGPETGDTILAAMPSDWRVTCYPDLPTTKDAQYT